MLVDFIYSQEVRLKLKAQCSDQIRQVLKTKIETSINEHLKTVWENYSHITIVVEPVGQDCAFFDITMHVPESLFSAVFSFIGSLEYREQTTTDLFFISKANALRTPDNRKLFNWKMEGAGVSDSSVREFAKLVGAEKDSNDVNRSKIVCSRNTECFLSQRRWEKLSAFTRTRFLYAETWNAWFSKDQVPLFGGFSLSMMFHFSGKKHESRRQLEILEEDWATTTDFMELVGDLVLARNEINMLFAMDSDSLHTYKQIGDLYEFNLGYRYYRKISVLRYNDDLQTIHIGSHANNLDLSVCPSTKMVANRRHVVILCGNEFIFYAIDDAKGASYDDRKSFTYMDSVLDFDITDDYFYVSGVSAGVRKIWVTFNLLELVFISVFLEFFNALESDSQYYFNLDGTKTENGNGASKVSTSNY